MASVSGALYSGHDHLVGHPLAVLGQAHETHEVDETSGKVQLAAKLAGCIVIGERVVVVVKSLTCKRDIEEQFVLKTAQTENIYLTCHMNT